jgi:hypothetical protein
MINVKYTIKKSLGGMDLNQKVGMILLPLLVVGLIVVIFLGQKFQEDKLETILADKDEVIESEVVTTQNNVVVEQEEKKTYLYENGEVGLAVQQVEDWELVNVIDEGSLNVTFSTGQVDAIITAVKTDKDNEEIKTELMSGAGDIEVLEEEDNYISFQSKMSNSIHTDIYIEFAEDKTFIYTFICLTSQYNNAKPQIDRFLESIEIGGA